jgi:hypothetical protein
VEVDVELDVEEEAASAEAEYPHPPSTSTPATARPPSVKAFSFFFATSESVFIDFLLSTISSRNGGTPIIIKVYI